MKEKEVQSGIFKGYVDLVLKTKDGKWVSPTLYFRGGTSVEPSKKMTEFRNKFNELLKEYTTVRESK